MFEISKNTYYNCKDKKESFLTKYDYVKKQVEKVISENSKYGIRRIKADLEQKYKIIIGRDCLGKLLGLWGLSLKRKIKKSKPSIASP